MPSCAVREPPTLQLVNRGEDLLGPLEVWEMSGVRDRFESANRE